MSEIALIVISMLLGALWWEALQAAARRAGEWRRRRGDNIIPSTEDMEVRVEDGQIDELVARDVDLFHLERLGGGAIYIGIGKNRIVLHTDWTDPEIRINADC